MTSCPAPNSIYVCRGQEEKLNIRCAEKACVISEDALTRLISVRRVRSFCFYCSHCWGSPLHGRLCLEAWLPARGTSQPSVRNRKSDSPELINSNAYPWHAFLPFLPSFLHSFLRSSILSFLHSYLAGTAQFHHGVARRSPSSEARRSGLPLAYMWSRGLC